MEDETMTEITGCFYCFFGDGERTPQCDDGCDNHQTEIQLVARRNAEEARQHMRRYEPRLTEDEWVTKRMREVQ
jgi:hypothetical protein